MSNLIAKEYKCFEDIKHIKEDGADAETKEKSKRRKAHA